MQEQEPWRGCLRCDREHVQCRILAGQESCTTCSRRGLVCITNFVSPENLLYKPPRRAPCESCRQKKREGRCVYVQDKAACEWCKKLDVECTITGNANRDHNLVETAASIVEPSSACLECRREDIRCARLVRHQVCEHCLDAQIDCTLQAPDNGTTDEGSAPTSQHNLGMLVDSDTTTSGYGNKPQCWDHGCNGRQFSTPGHLLQHRDEMARTTTRIRCLRCGMEFSHKLFEYGGGHGSKCMGTSNKSIEFVAQKSVDQSVEAQRACTRVPPAATRDSHTRDSWESAHPVQKGTMSNLRRKSHEAEALSQSNTTKSRAVPVRQQRPSLARNDTPRSKEKYSRERSPGPVRTYGRKSQEKSLGGHRYIYPDDSSSEEDPWERHYKATKDYIAQSRNVRPPTERDTAYCLRCKTWTSTCNCEQDLRVASASDVRQHRTYSSGASSDGAHYESRSRRNSMPFAGSTHSGMARNGSLTRTQTANSGDFSCNRPSRLGRGENQGLKIGSEPDLPSQVGVLESPPDREAPRHRERDRDREREPYLSRQERRSPPRRPRDVNFSQAPSTQRMGPRLYKEISRSYKEILSTQILSTQISSTRKTGDAEERYRANFRRTDHIAPKERQRPKVREEPPAHRERWTDSDGRSRLYGDVPSSSDSSDSWEMKSQPELKEDDQNVNAQNPPDHQDRPSIRRGTFERMMRIAQEPTQPIYDQKGRPVSPHSLSKGEDDMTQKPDEAVIADDSAKSTSEKVKMKVPEKTRTEAAVPLRLASNLKQRAAQAKERARAKEREEYRAKRKEGLMELYRQTNSVSKSESEPEPGPDKVVRRRTSGRAAWRP